MNKSIMSLKKWAFLTFSVLTFPQMDWYKPAVTLGKQFYYTVTVSSYNRKTRVYYQKIKFKL